MANRSNVFHADRGNHFKPDKSESQTISEHGCAKPRAILTKQQAIIIFQRKIDPLQGRAKPCAAAIARIYGLSEKAIRDIWKGRTWCDETSQFEPSRPARAAGPPGRPKGGQRPLGGSRTK